MIIFAIFEMNKKELSLLIEDTKLNLIKLNDQSYVKIFIKKNDLFKKYIIFKNININNMENAEYWTYFITDNKIKSAEFSNSLKLINNSFFAEKHTQYNNNFIKDINRSKVIEVRSIMQKGTAKGSSLKSSCSLEDALKTLNSEKDKQCSVINEEGKKIGKVK